MKKISYIFFCLVSLIIISCKKEEQLTEPADIVKLKIAGYVMTDTLEFVVREKTIGQAIEDVFTITNDSQEGALFNAGDEILIRKKDNKTEVGKIRVGASPFNQRKKIFFDGKVLSENLVLTPVSSPANMGFRLQFSTIFPDFYGGPVDVEFFEQSRLTRPPRTVTYTSVKLIKNVTGAFGDFIELLPLTVESGKTKAYVFKVYKGDTKELPYTKLDNVALSDPANNYGTLGDVGGFVPGSSMLISISPYLANGKVNDGYQTRDFAFAFH